MFRKFFNEAQIDLGEASAVSRAISRALSCRHRGVQGRKPLPAAPSPPSSSDPDCISVNGPRPNSCFAGPAQKFGPFGPTLQFGPASLPGGFSFGRASPIRPDYSAIFFYFTEKPLNFPD
ncbi:hypothetical protein CRG98_027427 [Punica granatum]|uniref:Uncharacterized protein n=1 Tax=Punica granatum TaxID=22663 RepID=A0A2I0J7G9_PUNGR|nr:hypothetical protein CRG98_027427 [Punica granatum]